MSRLDEALARQRAATEAFPSAAREVAAADWHSPRAPGKWSPAQVVDHVAIATRIARESIGETPAPGGFPRFLRWLPRKFYFERVLSQGFPPAGKGPPAFAPAATPAPREDLLARLTSAVTQFEAEARSAAAAGRAEFEHRFFGRIRVADYVRFNALHLDHHLTQLRPG